MTLLPHREKIKVLYTKHERYLFPMALFLGFVVDNFTLTRIDLWFDNLILFSYLTLAGIGISVVNLYESGYLQKGIIGRASRLAPFVVQYAFGGLFSGFFIFYSRSATLVESWPFIFLLLGLLIGNEFFKKRYLRFDFQMSVFFVSLFSFNIFFIPILLSDIGAKIFLLSGFVSLVILGLFVFLISRFLPKLVSQGRKILMASVGGIYIIINIFYFTNIIPPIPLSMKDAGVYHSVERVNGDYLVKSEEQKWYEVSKKYIHKYHRMPNESVYFYSAVFSPTDLDTTIYHSWQYFDEDEKEWIESFKKGYKIIGGRDGGYRGYTIKENVFAGRWRVDVMTERKQLLGRYKFTIIDVENSPELEIKTK